MSGWFQIDTVLILSRAIGIREISSPGKPSQDNSLRLPSCCLEVSPAWLASLALLLPRLRRNGARNRSISCSRIALRERMGRPMPSVIPTWVYVNSCSLTGWMLIFSLEILRWYLEGNHGQGIFYWNSSREMMLTAR